LVRTSFKASETKVVKEEELAEAKKLMPPEIYEAEYECSFESSAIGAIYSQGLNKADEDQVVSQKFLMILRLKVDTFWDLGMADKTSIWFVSKKAQQYTL
jgi:hypothetical protein